MHQIGTKYVRQQAFQESEREEIGEANILKNAGEEHYIISHTKNNPVNLYSFVQMSPLDPAKKVALRTSTHSSQL